MSLGRGRVGDRGGGGQHFAVRESTKKTLSQLFMERARFPCFPAHFAHHSLRGVFLLKSFIPGCWACSHVLITRFLPHSSTTASRLPCEAHSLLGSAAFCSASKTVLHRFFFFYIPKVRHLKVWKVTNQELFLLLFLASFLFGEGYSRVEIEKTWFNSFLIFFIFLYLPHLRIGLNFFFNTKHQTESHQTLYFAIRFLEFLVWIYLNMGLTNKSSVSNDDRNSIPTSSCLNASPSSTTSQLCDLGQFT